MRGLTRVSRLGDQSPPKRGCPGFRRAEAARPRRRGKRRPTEREASLAKLRRVGYIIAVLAASVAPAPASAFPTRNVEIIVSYGPGGSTDIIARIVAQKLQERLGQSFVVLNRPGAGGTIGMTAALRAAPDGHTLYNSY